MFSSMAKMAWLFMIPTSAFADKYGIDESLAESGGFDLSALGILALPVIFWACANIPMVWVTVGIGGLIFSIGGLSSKGPALYVGLLSLAAAWYGYKKEQAESVGSGNGNASGSVHRELPPQQSKPIKQTEHLFAKEENKNEDGKSQPHSILGASTDGAKSSSVRRPEFKPITSRHGDELIARDQQRISSQRASAAIRDSVSEDTETNFLKIRIKRRD